MANSNGSRTIQCNEDLAKQISILAINLNKTRREIVDEALKQYLENSRC